MSTKAIPADERAQVVTQDLLEDDAVTIRAEEDGPDMRIYGSEDDEGEGIPFRSDDEIPIPEEEGFFGGSSFADGLWIETEGSEAGTVTVLKGVALRRNTRRDARVSGVRSSTGESPPAASDAYSHYHDTVELYGGSGGGTEEVDVDPPDRGETLTIHVDDLTGPAHAVVEYKDEAGNVVTARDDDDNSDYAGDGSTDIFVTVPVTSPEITVKIVDDSGASNTADYSIYAR